MVNNGAMMESRSGVAVIKDVDIEVFAAFCEFAYTGEYESALAKYTIQKSKSDKEVAGSTDDDDHNNLQRTRSDVKKPHTGNDVDKRDNEKRDSMSGLSCCALTSRTFAIVNSRKTSDGIHRMIFWV